MPQTAPQNIATTGNHSFCAGVLVAPFIEEAKSKGQLYIHQPYELYSAENHEAWRRLYTGIEPLWQQYAGYMGGVKDSF